MSHETIDHERPAWTGAIPLEAVSVEHLASAHGWTTHTLGPRIAQLLSSGGTTFHDGHVQEHLLGPPLPTPHWHTELPRRVETP
jgi:hypothetical protein